LEEALKIFFSDLDFQWQQILEIYNKIEEKMKKLELKPNDEELLDSLAYKLHNLYCAYEDLLKIVAKFFDNQIEDTSQYHIEILKRMMIDIKGIRPNLISKEAYKYLDELRGFRHIFRHAYAYELDVERIKMLGGKSLKLKSIFQDCLNSFKKRLQEE
jgi:hypothetical protein